MAKKVSAVDKMQFVQNVIMSDIFNSSNEFAVAILQQLVDDAKKEVATKFVNKQDAEARKSGKMVANKKDAIKNATSKLSFDEDSIYGAYARELGVKL